MRLRPWCAADVGAITAILADAEVMAFSDSGPLDATQAAARLADSIADAPSTLDGLGCWAIETRTDHGAIGYLRLGTGEGRTGTGEIELGVRLAKAHWGQGYAVEAAEAVIARARTAGRATRLIAIVDPGNHRSVALLRKLGMTCRGDIMLDGYDHPDQVFVRALRSSAG